MTKKDVSKIMDIADLDCVDKLILARELLVDVALKNKDKDIDKIATEISKHVL